MKNLFLYFVILSSFQLSAQSEWNKDDRSNLYQEFTSELAKYGLSTNQKESIALCCLEQITEKYNKRDFQAKIEIELKRIHESTITQCSKNLGIELTKTSENIVTENVINSTNWTKEDKQKLSSEFQDFLKSYSHLLPEEKDLLIICFIEELTSKKTKQDYMNLIDLEIKQLRSTILKNCCEEKHISLLKQENEASPNQQIEKTFREKIIGKWSTDQYSIIEFKSDGTFINTYTSNFDTKLEDEYRVYSISGLQTTGNWFLDNSGELTINENVTLEWYVYTRRDGKRTLYENYITNSTWKITELSEKFLKIEFTQGSFCCKPLKEDSRITPFNIIQANKL